MAQGSGQPQMSRFCDSPNAIWGANLNMDADGNIESITDGQTVLMGYCFLLEKQGTPRPDNILLD
ncbi:MAG: hypothetical protein OXT07_16755 [bacterium]|nr:hypothetical protein [bacterium]